MPGRMMTEKEKAAITVRAFALMDEGKEDEGMSLFKTIPMPPFLAKINKEKFGVKCLNDLGWNLAEAEAEFGQDWLNR